MDCCVQDYKKIREAAYVSSIHDDFIKLITPGFTSYRKISTQPFEIFKGLCDRYHYFAQIAPIWSIEIE